MTTVGALIAKPVFMGSRLRGNDQENPGADAVRYFGASARCCGSGRSSSFWTRQLRISAT